MWTIILEAGKSFELINNSVNTDNLHRRVGDFTLFYRYCNNKGSNKISLLIIGRLCMNLQGLFGKFANSIRRTCLTWFESWYSGVSRKVWFAMDFAKSIWRPEYFVLLDDEIGFWYKYGEYKVGDEIFFLYYLIKWCFGSFRDHKLCISNSCSQIQYPTTNIFTQFVWRYGWFGPVDKETAIWFCIFNMTDPIKYTNISITEY